eukprot:191125-Pelagomonas_calceolata.AAC.1
MGIWRVVGHAPGHRRTQAWQHQAVCALAAVQKEEESWPEQETWSFKESVGSSVPTWAMPGVAYEFGEVQTFTVSCL